MARFHPLLCDPPPFAQPSISLQQATSYQEQQGWKTEGRRCGPERGVRLCCPATWAPGSTGRVGNSCLTGHPCSGSGTGQGKLRQTQFCLLVGRGAFPHPLSPASALDLAFALANLRPLVRVSVPPRSCTWCWRWSTQACGRRLCPWGHGCQSWTLPYAMAISPCVSTQSGVTMRVCMRHRWPTTRRSGAARWSWVWLQVREGGNLGELWF